MNAEFLDGVQIAAPGGLIDFTRGAAASAGGCAIIALAAASRTGRSRIVARLESPAITLARSDAAVIVTEHGAADLRGLDLDARAHAMIAIAAPAAREDLSRAWHEMRGRL